MRAGRPGTKAMTTAEMGTSVSADNVGFEDCGDGVPTFRTEDTEGSSESGRPAMRTLLGRDQLSADRAGPDQKQIGSFRSEERLGHAREGAAKGLHVRCASGPEQPNDRRAFHRRSKDQRRPRSPSTGGADPGRLTGVQRARVREAIPKARVVTFLTEPGRQSREQRPKGASPQWLSTHDSGAPRAEQEH